MLIHTQSHDFEVKRDDRHRGHEDPVLREEEDRSSVLLGQHLEDYPRPEDHPRVHRQGRPLRHEGVTHLTPDGAGEGTPSEAARGCQED